MGISKAVYQSDERKRKRAKELSRIKSLIIQIRGTMPRIGTPKLYHLLKDEFEHKGIKIGRDTLFDYLRSESMLVKPKKNDTKTTDSKHWLRKYPNLMKEARPTRPEQYFVSDIIYVKSRERTHYLSLETDAFSRKIMGYQLRDDMSADGVVNAMRIALKCMNTNDGLIHHSDRGLQYCSSTYQHELQRHGGQAFNVRRL